MNLEILFSIWFFHFLLMGEIALIRKTGFQFGRMHQKGGGWGDPLVQWQCMGALFVFVGWGLWTARRHLRVVFRKAWNNDPDVDDAGELLSYRTAVIGLIVGVAYIVAYLLKAGVAPGLLLITIPAAIVIYIALARFVCESGTLYLGIPTTPLNMGFQLIGTVTIDPRTIAVGSTAHALRWMLFMPALSQCAKFLIACRGISARFFGCCSWGWAARWWSIFRWCSIWAIHTGRTILRSIRLPGTRPGCTMRLSRRSNLPSQLPGSGWCCSALGGSFLRFSLRFGIACPGGPSIPWVLLLRRRVFSTRLRRLLSSGCSKPL